MKVIYGKSALELENIPPSTVTVGTFDGIHKGHMALLERLIKAAAENNTISIMATFDPHPQMMLGQRGQTEILNTNEEKLERLEKLNLDIVVVLDFNRQLASLDAESFIKRILLDCLNMKRFVVGYDHSFGKNRSGNIKLVKSLADDYNYTFEMVGPVHNGDQPIKSSRIRKELKTGDYNKAVEMLGYNYFLTGEIIRGMGVGKKLGYPTININIPSGKLLPKDGVYAAMVHVDNRIIPGMAYIGGRLTFGDETINVEVNLFDFSEDILGKKVKLTLEQYTRDPKKFESSEELIAALAEDKKQIKNILHI
ncbi:MAG: bifunctional riboflavin kinase/FAD synthetase [candidate division Zixibacteria bacterium]|nr:bifunctional riboflavin kinase/FAD synthetase [candidate division Zixibacteria bacterium]